MDWKGLILLFSYQSFKLYFTYALRNDSNLVLLMANRKTIDVMNLETRNVSTLAYGQASAYFIDYVPKQRYVYWTDASFKTISRLRYPTPDNCTVETIVISTDPRGIVIDEMDDKVYWVEYAKKGKIMRCGLDGSNATVILNSEEPFGLALDTRGRWLYFSSKTIEKCQLDGSERQIVVPDYSSYIHVIAIDESEGRLYWTDFYNGFIKSVNLDGTDIRLVLTTPSQQVNPIEVYGNFIYFINSKAQNLYRLEKGSSKAVIIKNGTDGNGLKIIKIEDPDQPRTCRITSNDKVIKVISDKDNVNQSSNLHNSTSNQNSNFHNLTDNRNFNLHNSTDNQNFNIHNSTNSVSSLSTPGFGLLFELLVIILVNYMVFKYL